MARRVAELVKDRTAPTVCRAEYATRRHLNVIGAERIKGAVAADPNCHPAVRDDCLGAVGGAPGCFSGTRRSELGNALDLASVKEGEGAQQWDASRLFLAVSRALPGVGQLDLFEKISCRSASALLQLPASIRRLFVGSPTRVGAGKSEWRRRQSHDVDAAVAHAGNGIVRHAGVAGLVRIPRFSPRWRAGFESGNDLVSNFHVLVARRVLAFGAATAELAHQGVLSSGLWITLPRPAPGLRPR